MTQTGKFTLLLASLVAFLFFLTPFPAESLVGTLARRLLFATILLAGVYAVSERRRWFLVALALAIPPVLMGLVTAPGSGTISGIIQLVFATAALMLTAGLILVGIMEARRVTGDTIAGGICVYLLLGLVWTFVFALIHSIEPGAFQIPESLLAASPGQAGGVDITVFSYFSFTTLTTLGYGDMSPITPFARAMTSAEAVVGQLYVAILISRLVGLHISQPKPD